MSRIRVAALLLATSAVARNAHGETRRISVEAYRKLVAPFPAKFKVKPFKVVKGAIQAGSWRWSDELLEPGARVVVVASWCPYSVELMNELTKGNESEKVAMVLFFEDEFRKFVEAAVQEGEIAPDEARKARALAKKRSLVDPKAIEAMRLPFFLISGEAEFGQHMTGYPSRFRCDARQCALALSK